MTARCPYCNKSVRLLQGHRLWPHGPRNDRCKGSWMDLPSRIAKAVLDNMATKRENG